MVRLLVFVIRLSKIIQKFGFIYCPIYQLSLSNIKRVIGIGQNVHTGASLQKIKVLLTKDIELSTICKQRYIVSLGSAQWCCS